MIIVTGTVRARPETRDEVVRLSLEHVHRSREEPGWLLHSVHRDVEDGDRLVFVEHWTDHDALRAHFRVPASGAFAKAVAGLAAEPATIEIYDATPVAFSRGPRMIPRDDPADITDRFDHADMIESALPADPIENAEANDPIEPIESAEPIEPIDSTDPLDPMQSSESSDHSDRDDDFDRVTVRDDTQPPSSGDGTVVGQLRADHPAPYLATSFNAVSGAVYATKGSVVGEPVPTVHLRKT